MPSEENYKLIEGDFKDFRIRRITPADYQNVFNHIAENFTKDELVSSVLGWSQGYADDVNRVVEFALKDGMSFLVEHRESGKIACTRITYHRTPASIALIRQIPIHTRNARCVFKFNNDIMEKADLFGRFGIDSWAELLIASTNREFRNQGLTGVMYDRSLAFLKAEGYKHAFVIVTSPWTQQCTRNRGFIQTSGFDLVDLVDHDGVPVFKKEELKPEHFAFSMVKVLNE